jgi:alpha-L-fucosidase
MKSSISVCFLSLFVALALLPSLEIRAQTRYEPTLENLEAREWFRDARFGLFVHWGIYSTLASGEWVMNIRSIPIAQYENLARFFNPVDFDAREWVRLVKRAGMRYITITSKHHDGFAMFDSKVSDWDIVDRTPYGRDVLAELAEACRAEGIKLFFYYSQLDWHHPDYYPRGGTGRSAGRPDHGDWDAYIDYMNAQLSELLTGYGDVGGIWFDGMWDRPDAPWRLDETYALIHRLQPAALIGSNHHQDPLPGEDFQMFEKDLPGGNTAGWNNAAISSLPLETAETVASSWGYNITDRNFKSTDDLLRYLINAAGRDANFLLNVGPMPNGEIQVEFRERLAAMGDWLDRFGETIYGTRGGPIPPGAWGVSTSKDDLVYVHVLDWPETVLALPWRGGEIKSARLFESGTPVRFKQEDGALVLWLPARPQGVVDQVVTLTTE